MTSMVTVDGVAGGVQLLAPLTVGFGVGLGVTPPTLVCLFVERSALVSLRRSRRIRALLLRRGGLFAVLGVAPNGRTGKQRAYEGHRNQANASSTSAASQRLGPGTQASGLVLHGGAASGRQSENDDGDNLVHDEFLSMNYETRVGRNYQQLLYILFQKKQVSPHFLGSPLYLA